MRNTIGLLFLSSTFFGIPVLSEYDKLGINANNFVTRDGGITSTYSIRIHKWNSITGNYQVLNDFYQAEQSDFNTANDWKKDRIDINNSFYDSINGQIHFKSSTSDNKFIYDVKKNTFTTSTYERDKTEASYELNFDIPAVNGRADGSFDVEIGGNKIIKKNADGSVQLGNDTDDIDVVADGINIDGIAVITKNADGTIQIGTDANDIDITSEGLAIDGDPLITKKANGELSLIHI